MSSYLPSSRSHRSLRTLLAALALAGLILAACTPAQAQQGGRSRTLLDRGWRFLLGDAPGAGSPQFDDAGWQYVNLPHSFSEPYFRSPDFYIGFGWYRRHLNLTADQLRGHQFLDFDGAFQQAEVFVNGTRIGDHLGGYTGFSLDMTGALRPGDNLIAVRVNNRWNPQLDPRAGEHVFSGGIYRDVYLVTTSDVYVTWYGTFVTTPRVSAADATLDVKTEVHNALTREAKAELRTSILDPHGHEVDSLTTEQVLAADETATLDQTGAIHAPSLWSPDSPSLYTAVSRLYVRGKLMDEYRTPFGVRWFTWTADDGFALNGKHLYFHGADVHQDHAGWGDAVSQAGARRDVAMVKDAGFDFIRGSHYPHDPAFAQACDELGVLFWSENPFWGIGGYQGEGYFNASSYPTNPADQKPFEQHVEQSLREMIRINRNHPSIIVWSMSNEPYFAPAAVMPRVRDLLRAEVALSHQLDPTRPAAIGGAQRGDIYLLGDVAGFNGDGARLFIHPPVANAVTEYGSYRTVRPGLYDAHLRDLKGQPEFPWRGGQAIWSMFDHGSIAGAEGTTGIVDYFRLPKLGWYWYRNALRGIPPPPAPQPGVPAALQLTSSSPVVEHADGSDDVQLIVTVLDAAGHPLSNSPDVTLAVVSGPGSFPTGRSITFRHGTDIPILDGKAAIEFRPYYSGTAVIRASSPGLPEADLRIDSRGGPPYVAGKSPVFQPGPYVRFVRVAPGTTTGTNVVLDRPTNASSSAADHSSRLATDGNPATAWMPDPTADGAQWWESDLEGVYDLSSLRLQLAGNGQCGYQVQVSHDDRTSWTPVYQGRANVGDPPFSLQLPPLTRGSALRIVLGGSSSSAACGLAEVQAFGTRAP